MLLILECVDKSVTKQCMVRHMKSELALVSDFLDFVFFLSNVTSLSGISYMIITHIGFTYNQYACYIKRVKTLLSTTSIEQIYIT